MANAFNLKAANGSQIVTVSTSNVGSPIGHLDRPPGIIALATAGPSDYGIRGAHHHPRGPLKGQPYL